jgi:CRP-like cAMP-binding protein
MTPTDVLRGVPLFAGMTDRAIEAISGLTTEVEYRDGEAIVSEGEAGESFIVLVSGSAAVDRGGREVRELTAGDFLGELSLVDGGPRTATVTARGPVRALIVTRPDFSRLFDEFGAIRLDILTALTARIRRDETDPQL